MEPDLAGFQQAQRRLHRQLGQPVTFERPVHVGFPGVPTDPETGEPFDPVIAAQAASAVASASATCTVAHKPAEGDQTAAQLGWMESAHVMLAGDPELASGAASAATHFIVRDERFQIVGSGQDPSLAERTIIFGRRT